MSRDETRTALLIIPDTNICKYFAERITKTDAHYWILLKVIMKIYNFTTGVWEEGRHEHNYCINLCFCSPSVGLSPCFGLEIGCWQGGWSRKMFYKSSSHDHDHNLYRVSGSVQAGLKIGNAFVADELLCFTFLWNTLYIHNITFAKTCMNQTNTILIILCFCCCL